MFIDVCVAHRIMGLNVNSVPLPRVTKLLCNLLRIDRVQSALFSILRRGTNPTDRSVSLSLPATHKPQFTIAIMVITEGKIAFNPPNTDKRATTWYKIIGDYKNSSSPPLIACHGGPGAGHESLASLSDLHELYGIPVILYDQIGCGNSTHFRDKMGDNEFWSIELFWAELDNLIDFFQLRDSGYYLYGQSWGGMLVGSYAAKQPVGLKKAILSSGPASGALYQKSATLLLNKLPPDVRKTLEDCERRGDHESDEFREASMVFLKRHVCRLDPFPDDILKAFQHLDEDPTSYLTV